MPNWGFKISKEGFDVKTCSDENLVMSSEFNMLKAKLVGTSTGSETVAHGLAYTPVLFACGVISSTKSTILGQVHFSAIPSTDGTNLYTGGAIKYYIFYQQGATV